MARKRLSDNVLQPVSMQNMMHSRIIIFFKKVCKTAPKKVQYTKTAKGEPCNRNAVLKNMYVLTSTRKLWSFSLR